MLTVFLKVQCYEFTNPWMILPLSLLQPRSMWKHKTRQFLLKITEKPGWRSALEIDKSVDQTLRHSPAWDRTQVKVKNKGKKRVYL